MASLHLLKSTFSPVSLSFPNFPGKSDSGKPILRLTSFSTGSSRKCIQRVKSRVSCSVQEGDNGEEPPESLFMKELKRRGMTPTSLLEDTNRGSYAVEDEMKLGEEDRDFSKRSTVSTEFGQSLSNQRERSMALNSEGLQGLIPHARLLLTTGGTFFLGFWPLILVTVAFFSALYIYLGENFVHDASKMSISPPPYKLLEDESISQITPSLK